MRAGAVRFHPTGMGACCLATSFSLPLHQRLQIGELELQLCRWLPDAAQLQIPAEVPIRETREGQQFRSAGPLPVFSPGGTGKIKTDSDNREL